MAKTLNLQEVATLTTLEGKGFVRHSDGTRSELIAGMKLSLGDIVITMPGGKASVQILDGRHFELSRSQGDAIKIDQAVLDVVVDIQDVRVTDLSLVYPYVAHHIVTDPTVDPLSINNEDLSNDLSQLGPIEPANDPAAINDLGGGDLLSGNTYVVLHENPILTQPTPFITEPGHFNNGFIPVNNPGFVPAATPLVHLISAEPPVPAYVPIITLSMATTLLDPTNANLIDTSHSIPLVDDEAGFVAYTVHTTNQNDPQHFNVRVFNGDADTTGHLLVDGLNNPVVVNPLDVNNTFYVPVSEDQEGLNIHVKLEPIDTAVNFSTQELTSVYTVGELGSERDAPASLHISISTPTIDYTESSNGELVAHYQVKLLDAHDAEVKLDHPLTVHWVLQNQFSPNLNVEGDVTFQANQSSGEIVANVPEEDISNTNPTENYTLGLLLDNNVNVTSGGQQLTISSTIIDSNNSVYSNLANDLTTHANQFLVSTNSELSFINDALSEVAEESVTAQFSTNVTGTLPLDDDTNNISIQFTITSSELPSLWVNPNVTLTFDVNVYDEQQQLVGTLAELNGHAGSLSFNQLVFDVPVDLSKIHQPGSSLSDNLYVSDSALHGHSLTFQIVPVSFDAVALFNNLNTSNSSVTGSVADDSAYEAASASAINIDSGVIDNTNHGIAIFSSNQVMDPALTIQTPVYDELVKFTVDFDKQFGDATFDVIVHGPNNSQSLETINIGTTPSSGSVTPITSSNGDLVYESTAPDGTTVDYIVHTDGTSSLAFYAALPNTEDSPQYNVSIAPTSNIGAPAPTDTNGNVIEDTSALHITSAPYILVPDVHVTATIDGLISGAIDDEAAVNVTLHLDHQLAQDTQYHVVIQSSDGSQFYAGDQTISKDTSDFSFSAGQLTDSFENKDLVVTLTDITTGAVYFSGNTNADAVKVNVVNDPTPVLVQDLVNDPIAITVTPPSTLIDDENPLQTTATFSYQVQGEFLNTALATPSNDPNFNWASVKFDVYTQALDANNNPVGSLHSLAVDPLTLDLSNQSGSVILSGTFDIPISLLGDGHQQIVLEPQDPSISALFPVNTTPFDVIDMSYQVITDSGSGIDTYVLVDLSDGTSTVVNPSTGNHIESLDLLQSQGDTTTFQLDFGNHVVAGTSADFNSNHVNSNPIDHLIFHSNGFIEFGSQEGPAIPIDQSNLQQAIDYLAQNCKQVGTTVEFNVDNNGVNSSYVFHQSAAGYNLVNVSDTAGVAGVDTQNFSQSTIHIIDHQ